MSLPALFVVGSFREAIVDMRPNWFFDFEAIGGEDSGLSLPVLRGRMLIILHGFFQQQPHTYAVALPMGLNRLRVFSTTRDEIDALARHLQTLPWVRDYTRLSYPQLVQSDFNGKWIAFSRYRIPTEKSDRKTGEQHGQLRRRRIQAVVDEKMDYFMLRSGSTGQRFTLVVKRLPGTPCNGECFPNSYGFSSSSQSFSLPDLP